MNVEKYKIPTSYLTQNSQFPTQIDTSKSQNAPTIRRHHQKKTHHQTPKIDQNNLSHPQRIKLSNKDRRPLWSSSSYYVLPDVSINPSTIISFSSAAENYNDYNVKNSQINSYPKQKIIRPTTSDCNIRKSQDNKRQQEISNLQRKFNSIENLFNPLEQTSPKKEPHHLKPPTKFSKHPWTSIKPQKLNPLPPLQKDNTLPPTQTKFDIPLPILSKPTPYSSTLDHQKNNSTTNAADFIFFSTTDQTSPILKIPKKTAFLSPTLKHIAQCSPQFLEGREGVIRMSMMSNYALKTIFDYLEMEKDGVCEGVCEERLFGKVNREKGWESGGGVAEVVGHAVYLEVERLVDVCVRRLAKFEDFSMVWDLNEGDLERVFGRMSIPNLYFMESSIAKLTEPNPSMEIPSTTKFWRSLYLKVYSTTFSKTNDDSLQNHLSRNPKQQCLLYFLNECINRDCDLTIRILEDFVRVIQHDDQKKSFEKIETLNINMENRIVSDTRFKNLISNYFIKRDGISRVFIMSLMFKNLEFKLESEDGAKTFCDIVLEDNQWLEFIVNNQDSCFNISIFIADENYNGKDSICNHENEDLKGGNLNQFIRLLSKVTSRLESQRKRGQKQLYTKKSLIILSTQNKKGVTLETAAEMLKKLILLNIAFTSVDILNFHQNLKMIMNPTSNQSSNNSSTAWNCLVTPTSILDSIFMNIPPSTLFNTLQTLPKTLKTISLSTTSNHQQTYNSSKISNLQLPPSLLSLSLSNFQIPSINLKILNSTNLKILNLAQIDFSTSYKALLSTPIEKIEIIKLRSNNLLPRMVSLIINKLMHAHAKVRELDLSGNNFDGEVGMEISSLLKINFVLEGLRLDCLPMVKETMLIGDEACFAILMSLSSRMKMVGVGGQGVGRKSVFGVSYLIESRKTELILSVDNNLMVCDDEIKVLVKSAKKSKDQNGRVLVSVRGCGISESAKSDILEEQNNCGFGETVFML